MSVTTIDLRDETTFRATWNAHRNEMQRFAQRLLSDAEGAEDAVQEAFFRAWRRADQFDATRGTPRTWLFAILRYVIIDRARADAARPRMVRVEVEVGDAERGVDAVVESIIVDRALDRLSPDHRRTLVQRYYGGEAGIEIARRGGVPLGTVRSRLFYALKALRAALDDVGFEP